MLVLISPGQRKIGSRTETWTATICPSRLNAVCYKVRKKGQRSMSSKDAPPYVREFLLLGGSARMGASWAEIVALTATPAVVSAWWKKDGVVITFKVDVPVLKPPEAQLQSAIAGIENAVNDIRGERGEE